MVIFSECTMWYWYLLWHQFPVAASYFLKSPTEVCHLFTYHFIVDIMLIYQRNCNIYCKHYFLAIKRAKDTLEKDLRLFASPWSSPWWMKTNKKMQHPGKLIGNVSGKYYKTWANYFVKFLQEYEKNGVNFWGLTVENEPNAGSGPRYYGYSN